MPARSRRWPTPLLLAVSASSAMVVTPSRSRTRTPTSSTSRANHYLLERHRLRAFGAPFLLASLSRLSDLSGETGAPINRERPMPRFYDTCAGPIGGLYLPPVAWDVLQREKIQNIEHLVDIADRLEQVEGIEPRM